MNTPNYFTCKYFLSIQNKRKIIDFYGRWWITIFWEVIHITKRKLTNYSIIYAFITIMSPSQYFYEVAKVLIRGQRFPVPSTKVHEIKMTISCFGIWDSWHCTFEQIQKKFSPITGLCSTFPANPVSRCCVLSGQCIALLMSWHFKVHLCTTGLSKQHNFSGHVWSTEHQ